MPICGDALALQDVGSKNLIGVVGTVKRGPGEELSQTAESRLVSGRELCGRERCSVCDAPQISRLAEMYLSRRKGRWGETGVLVCSGGGSGRMWAFDLVGKRVP